MSVARHVTPAELSAVVGELRALIGKLDDQLGAHEDWHRDMLIKADQESATRRIARWALAVAVIGALAGVAAAVAAFLR